MSKKDKILVADDNPESIWPLIEYLEKDYEVIYATTPEKALTLAFSSNRPDLVLLDVVMPGMDGYQVFERLKNDRYTKDIPVVFITALSGDFDEVRGLELGAQDYITKPYSLPVVGARVKSVLNLKKEMDRRVVLKSQLGEINYQLERQVRSKIKELHEAQETLQTYEEKYNYLFKTADSESQKEKILVVDDNPENIYVLVDFLEKDYQVFFATSGKKALEIATSVNRPDVILLDVMMPEMDGYEVCSRLKANADTWHIPIIFITALDQEVDETKGLDMGAVDFIVKPFSFPVVKARIKAALRLKEEMDNRIVLTQKLEDLNKNLEKRVQEKTIALRQAHDDLLASEKRYRTIYETAIEGIFEASPQGRLKSASPSLARMLGYETPTDLLNSIQDIAKDLYVEAEERAVFKEVLEDKGEIFNFETRYKKKSGEIIWVLICAKCLHDNVTKEKYYQGFIVDITGQKKNEIDNLQHLRELRLLNKIIAASVIETENSNILETACKELSSAFHLPLAVAGLFVGDLSDVRIEAECLPDMKDESRIRSLKNTILSSDQFPFMAEVLKAGKPFVVREAQGDVRLSSFLDSIQGTTLHSLLFSPLVIEGQAAGILMLGATGADTFSEEKVRLVQSVTDQISTVMARILLDENRRELEKQYYQSQKMEAIGKLTGGVAHDFNNILTVIMSVADLMKLKLEPESELFSRLQQIQSAARRAGGLVRQLLAFSRQQILEPKKMSLSYVVDNFEKMLKRVIGEDIELVIALDQDLHIVKADQGQMEQVLMNLVVNARDAMPEGGRLTIETENVFLDEKYSNRHLDVQPGAYVMLAVSDTGVGIEKSLQEKIFDPFFTTKAPDQGTGLGLSTVHGIVQQSGGFIWLYSEPGQGSCFKMYLPIYMEESEKEQQVDIKAEELSVQGHGESILVVEDDETLSEIVSVTLTEYGYKVWTADRAQTAMEIFTSQDGKFDLLLSDVVIPGEENGVQLAERLCKQKPELKVLFMSGYTNKSIAHDKGLEHFIHKPFTPKDLAKKVQYLLDDH